MKSNLEDERREYIRCGLSRTDLDSDPLRQFDLWITAALDAELTDATAMSLATVGSDGQPTLRTVLLKYYDSNGFVFYTNLESNKARQIGENPKVALLFYWREFDRQVKITGSAGRVATSDSLKYFLTRPRDSQLGAWVSAQSRVIGSRALLEQKFEEMKRKFAGGEVPLPSFWGGFRVLPQTIEFWQGRVSRLHDCFIYRRQADDSWLIDRLAP
ncbi:MAG: pyridoxamine 5'-phosphate oxidase [Gammaproteobacteria bacterium]|nr:pyridoxamine 5'-phosphate oxidase [Gammaproteobacteria bacterium]